MRILLLSLLLACSLPLIPVAKQPACEQKTLGYPDWLVVDVLSAACEASEFFEDIGLEVLVGYYHDGTLQISYQGRDAVNPILGRYKVAHGGGMVVIAVDDGL